MSIDVQQTVREVALNTPAATRVFEKLGIDYCCGGNKPLAQACGEAHLAIDQVIASIESAARSAQVREDTPFAEDWSKAPLSDLIAHINNTHHKYTRDEIARLGPLLDKVCNVHGPSHPELLEIRHDFQALTQELTVHMMKEERVLFPFIERMEEAAIAREPVIPAPFGSVNNPVTWV